jgi:hypothetical protein
MALAQTRRPEEEQVATLAHEGTGSKLVELGALEGWIEGPVEVFQRAGIAESGVLAALFDEALIPGVEFVLDEQFEELEVGECMGGSLLETELKAGEESRQTESSEVLGE